MKKERLYTVKFNCPLCDYGYKIATPIHQNKIDIDYKKLANQLVA